MIEIKDIIDLQTNSEIKKVSFATRYLVDLNFTFDLSVQSNDFCGKAHFCVRRDEIEKLCEELSIMSLNLVGFTIINDNDSDGFLKFEFEDNGHLIVSGQIGGSHENNNMKFEFATDQTCIPKFVTDFKTLLLN